MLIESSKEVVESQIRRRWVEFARNCRDIIAEGVVVDLLQSMAFEKAKEDNAKHDDGEREGGRAL